MSAEFEAAARREIRSELDRISNNLEKLFLACGVDSPYMHFAGLVDAVVRELDSMNPEVPA